MTKDNIIQELRDNLRKNKQDPSNSRVGKVITFRKNQQINNIHLSAVPNQSNFQLYKRKLIEAQKKCRAGRGTYGWVTVNETEVIVEKYYDVPPKYFDKHPDEKHDFFTYSHAKQRCLVTKFYVTPKGKDTEVYHIYGKLEPDPFFEGDDD